MLGADPLTHMRRQLVIRCLHEIPFKRSNKLGLRRRIQRLAQLMQSTWRRYEQKLVELIACRSRVELLGNNRANVSFAILCKSCRSPTA